MMPLNLANAGETNIIKRIGGTADVKKHLEHLGFTVGGRVQLISALGGNIIVSVRGARVAVSREAACKIMVPTAVME